MTAGHYSAGVFTPDRQNHLKYAKYIGPWLSPSPYLKKCTVVMYLFRITQIYAPNTLTCLEIWLLTPEGRFLKSFYKLMTTFQVISAAMPINPIKWNRFHCWANSAVSSSCNGYYYHIVSFIRFFKSWIKPLINGTLSIVSENLKFRSSSKVGQCTSPSSSRKVMHRYTCTWLK